jgi:predicted GIY-YIG superfamily endonuclease
LCFRSKKIFACYLLESLAKPGKTYIGFTVNPKRRLRQHNGDIVGGARRTHKHRPWVMACLVFGFTSNISALTFEWAWQHPKTCLALKYQLPLLIPSIAADPRPRSATPCKKRRATHLRTAAYSIEKNLEILNVMLRTPPWNTQNLQVGVFHDCYENIFDSIKQKLASIDHQPLTVQKFSSIDDLLSLQKFQADLEETQADCISCFSKVEETKLFQCPKCKSGYHLTCLAKQQQENQIVPSHGTCMVCGYTNSWIEIVNLVKCQTIHSSSDETSNSELDTD